VIDWFWFWLNWIWNNWCCLWAWWLKIWWKSLNFLFFCLCLMLSFHGIKCPLNNAIFLGLVS
jgi:hypothetical protein